MSAMDEAGIMSRLWRRVQLMSSWGRVTFSEDAQSAQTLQVKLNNAETRDGTPRIAEFGFTSRPPDGSDVLVVFLGGDRSKGVVVATGHQASRPLGLAQGESMVYDLWGKSIYLTKGDGIVVEARGTPLTANDITTGTVNASEQILMNAPMVAVSDTLKVGNGASGSFTTPTGQTVMVQDGIITNIY